MGNYLLQAVQDPDSGHRAGDRDGGFDARYEQVPRLLSGDDLRGEPGQGRSADAAVNDQLFQVVAQ